MGSVRRSIHEQSLRIRLPPPRAFPPIYHPNGGERRPEGGQQLCHSDFRMSPDRDSRPGNQHGTAIAVDPWHSHVRTSRIIELPPFRATIKGVSHPTTADFGGLSTAIAPTRNTPQKKDSKDVNDGENAREVTKEIPGLSNGKIVKKRTNLNERKKKVHDGIDSAEFQGSSFIIVLPLGDTVRPSKQQCSTYPMVLQITIMHQQKEKDLSADDLAKGDESPCGVACILEAAGIMKGGTGFGQPGHGTVAVAGNQNGNSSRCHDDPYPPTLSQQRSHSQQPIAAGNPIDYCKRKFSCHICDRRFDKKHRVRAHVRFVHRREKESRCPLCDRCLCSPYSRNRHMQVSLVESIQFHTTAFFRSLFLTGYVFSLLLCVISL